MTGPLKVTSYSSGPSGFFSTITTVTGLELGSSTPGSGELHQRPNSTPLIGYNKVPVTTVTTGTDWGFSSVRVFSPQGLQF